MRRILILTTLSAATLAIGLGVGATLASADPAQPSPTVSTVMGNGRGDEMHDGAGMTQMMGSAEMNALHATMHDAMGDGMPRSSAEHTAHHQGSQP
jgi:hypothetical protein